MILRKDLYKDCLVLYPMSAWEEERKKFRERLDEYNEEHRDFYDQFVADSEAVEMDSAGRILIPKRYLQIASITGDVRFVGVDDKIKIWSRTQFEEFRKTNEVSFQMNARNFLAKKPQSHE
jgi:MraZ protein